MKKKVTFLMLTLVTLVTSISFISCNKDDEPTITENYYLQLTTVETNLVNANTGESLAAALRDAFLADPQFDSSGKFSIGKTTKENAIDAFNQSIENFRKALNDVYAGKELLPENGYVVYNFVLQNQSGTKVKSASLRVTNSGATTN